MNVVKAEAMKSAIRLKVTKTAHEATVRAYDPDTAIALAVKAHGMLLAHKTAGTAPEERSKANLPVMMRDHASGYVLQHGGGEATPYDPTLAETLDDYRVKIDLVANTKGIGWEVSVLNPGSIEAGVAMIGYVEEALRAQFPPS